jgi:transglutaminase-like putative cysteine protease
MSGSPSPRVRLNAGEYAPRWRAATLTVQVHVGCEFNFDSDASYPSVVQVQPHPGFEHALLRDSWEIDPAAALTEYFDEFGNRCQRVVIPVGRLTIRYDAIVEVPSDPDPVLEGATQVPPEILPAETLRFLLPSRYCLSDKLLGAAVDSFGDLEPGWKQVQAISHWVHEHLTYRLGSTDSMSDATEAYMERQGVCRDFAHLAISFCRALNYPARYVCGYIPLLGRPMPEEGIDFAAWMEVYLGGGWRVFDPRNDVPLAGRVLIGRGRDAVDVAMVTSAGAPRLESMKVWAEA